MDLQHNFGAPFGSVDGERVLSDAEFQRVVDDILGRQKVIHESMDWADKAHGDYVTCNMPVVVPEKPQFHLRLTLTAHLLRKPRKCSFILLLGGERIFALDVNPAAIHNNRDASGIVDCSHWTRWPCKKAEPDNRDLLHQQWWNEFLSRSNTDFYGRYDRPPYTAEQRDMFL